MIETAKNVWIQFRVSEEQRKEIQAAAEAENRTASNFLLNLFCEYQKRKEAEQRKPE